MIPKGFTATATYIYGSDGSNVIKIWQGSIEDGNSTEVTHAGGCTVNTSCDHTDISGDGLKYIVIEWDGGDSASSNLSDDGIYGGKITITRS